MAQLTQAIFRQSPILLAFAFARVDLSSSISSATALIVTTPESIVIIRRSSARFDFAMHRRPLTNRPSWI
jgi:hypothetical protein